MSEPALELAAERRRLDTLARVLPLAAIEPDGLAITSDGTYVRVIECEHVLQPWRGDLDHRLRLRERLKQLITRIPDRQALQLIVEAEPLEPRRALTQDWLEIRAAMAARRRGGADPAAIEAMENFGYGLEQTVRRSAAAVSAVAMRWWVVVPYRHRPSGIELPRLRRGDALTLRLREHEQAAYESSRLAANILSDLRGLECRARELDGSEYLALLSRWFHPGEEPWPAELFERLPRLLADTDPERARRHRGALLAALTRGAAIDLADPERIAYPNAGQVESIAHVTTPPDTTSLYWLLNLMSAPPPWRLVGPHPRSRPGEDPPPLPASLASDLGRSAAKAARGQADQPGGVRAGARGRGDRRRASPLSFRRLRRLDPALAASSRRSGRAARRRAARDRPRDGGGHRRPPLRRALPGGAELRQLPAAGDERAAGDPRLRLAEHRRLRSPALHLGELAGRGADRLRDPRQHPGADRSLRPRLPHPRRPDHRRLGRRQDGLRQHHPDALAGARSPGDDRRPLLLRGHGDRDPRGGSLRGPGRPGSRRREAPLRRREPRRGALPLGRPRPSPGELGEGPLPARPAHALDRGPGSRLRRARALRRGPLAVGARHRGGLRRLRARRASARGSRFCAASCWSWPDARRMPRTPTAIRRSPPSSVASPPGFTPTARAAPTPGSPTRRPRSRPRRRFCSATSPGFTPTWRGR